MKVEWNIMGQHYFECEYKGCHEKETRQMFNNDGFEYWYCGEHWGWGLDHLQHS